MSDLVVTLAIGVPGGLLLGAAAVFVGYTSDWPDRVFDRLDAYMVRRDERRRSRRLASGSAG